MRLPIYLDYAATTPVDPRAAEKMLAYLTQQGEFGNPASGHGYGRSAAQAVEMARQQVADLIGAKSHEIIWTSGATEANNLAIKGIAHFYKNKGNHIITCQSEHSAVFNTCKQLEREGFAVTYLTPEKNGVLDLQKVSDALRPQTILVSIMQVNNETGVIQDIAAIGALAHQHGAFFHVDAVQSVGKLTINLQELPVDLMVFSAHKLYGPKGIGALYMRGNRDLQLQVQLQGAGQERGMRSGTLPTHQIVGMGEAFALARDEMVVELPHLKKMRDFLWHNIREMGEIYLNGDEKLRTANILNISFADIDNNVLLPALKDLAVSTGSACHAGSTEPSRVLLSMGVDRRLAQNSLRFSLGRFTTEEEINYAIQKIRDAVTILRK